MSLLPGPEALHGGQPVAKLCMFTKTTTHLLTGVKCRATSVAKNTLYNRFSSERNTLLLMYHI